MRGEETRPVKITKLKMAIFKCVITFLTNQMIFNAGVQAHTHQLTARLPSVELQPIGVFTAGQLMSKVPTVWLNKVNMMMFDLNYLYPFSQKWICGYNRTN